MRGTFIPDFEITGMNAEGTAFGMHKGIRVLVEKGIPEDVVDIQMIKILKNDHSIATGKILKLKKSAAIRREPFCVHFNYCGGCQWQNVSYEDQIRLKQIQVKKLLAPMVEHFSNAQPLADMNAEVFLNPIRSVKQIHFRNRVTFTFSNRRWMSPDELENGVIDKLPAAGFALKGKNDRVMNIEECFLTDSFAVHFMKTLRRQTLHLGYSFYDARVETGFLRSVTLRFADENQIMCTVAFGEETADKIASVLDFIRTSFPQINSLFYVIHPRKRGSALEKTHVHVSGMEKLKYEVDGLEYHVSPASFYQTNSDQAKQLFRTAKEFAGLTGNEIVYDLYTGCGTIALYIGADAKKVIGIDYTRSSIEDALFNVEHNRTANAQFIAGDIASTFNAELIATQGKPYVIITDPPRAGMNRTVIQSIIESRAERIVYISCNPITQARDIRNLLPYYSLIKSQMIDMFPQTNHIENILLLKRRKSSSN